MPRIRLSAELDRRIRESARHRCGYCLSPQHLVMARLTIEHIIPLVEGGSNEEDNLWLSCSLCNSHKADKVTAIDPPTGERVPLFNPRFEVWAEHFRWTEDGLQIEGLTPTGRATALALHLNDDPIRLEVRRHWVRAGWHPPTD